MNELATILGPWRGTGHGHGDRSFRFQATKIHVTFPGHIDFDLMVNKAAEVGGGRHNILRLSVVHELGSETEDGMTEEDCRRYAHTHMAVQWRKKVDKQSHTFMDVKVDGVDIHCNIQVKKDMQWFKGLFMQYHAGKKAQVGGGYKYTKPVKLWQIGIENWEHDFEVMASMVRAPTLIDACLLGGIVAKSVGDVVHLRNAVKKRTCSQMLDSCDRPFRDMPDDWDPKKQSLLIIGGTNSGKTNCAINYFNSKENGNAFVIHGLDNLKSVPQHATGLVFDDQDYAKQSPQDQKMIFDCRIATTIHAGVYTHKEKPHLPAIFTSNDLSKLLSIDIPALQTRTYVWEIPDGEKMYV